MTDTLPRYPEHDKLRAVKDKSQAIGEFLETCGMELYEHLPELRECTQCCCEVLKEETGWTASMGRYHEAGPCDDGEVLHREAGYYPVTKGIRQILAEYLGIDQQVLDQEKRTMLDELHVAREVDALGDDR